MAPSPGTGAGPLALYRELARLGEAFLAELRNGRDGGADAFMCRREAILAALEARAAEVALPAEHCRESLDALQQVLAVDRELVAGLESRKREVRRAIDQLQHARASLDSFGGQRPTSPAYVDRLG